LGVFDLRDVAGRFRLLLALLNIARLFRTIASLCPESGMDEYTTLFRGNGIKIHIEPRRVVKCFPKTLFQHARSHLEEVYTILKDRSIPNVDHLHCVDSYHKRLIFHPRGDDKKPSTLAELFRALQDILRAVTELHKASWMHRDIRWANVIKHRDGSGSWFMIDFMDAAQSPQSAASGRHLSKKEHAPEIFNNTSHTVAVDIWSIGHLILTSGHKVYGSWYDMGSERTKFLTSLLHDDPLQRPAAAAALNQLNELERKYQTQLQLISQSQTT